MRRGLTRPGSVPGCVSGDVHGGSLLNAVWLAFVVAAFALLSGCSMVRLGPPAPVIDKSEVLEPEEPASEPVVAEPMEEASAPEETRPPAPKKPHHTIFKPRKPEPAPPPPAPAPPPPAPAPLITTRMIDRATTRTLLDAEVQKPDGKVVGRAVDMVADANGKPVQIVVNLQGFMGIGDRKASFPWSAIRVNPAAKTAPITLNPSPGQLPVPDRPRPAPTPTAPQGGQLPVTPVQLPMLDATVERPNGAKVGRVVDVLIDGAAQPQAVVLDVSGLIQQRRTIAANWSALRFVTKDKELHPLIDLSEAQINASPPYAANRPIQAVSPAVPAVTTASPPPAAPAPPASPGEGDKGAAVARNPK
ncbi:Photosystem reaction center subunit H [Paraburkholderia kururiensis]